MLGKRQWENVRLYLEKLFNQKVESTRINAITVNPPYHGQGKRTIRIGSVCAELEPGQPPEEVVAIYESKSFLVCTTDRGAKKGLPYIFPRETVIKVDLCDD